MNDIGPPLPWLVPSLGVWLLLSVAAGGIAGRTLGVRRSLAWALVMSFGLIVSLTLLPLQEGLAYGARGTGTCDLSRIALGRLDEYLKLGDPIGNVLMFLPLGTAIALMGRSRTKAAALFGAILLPFVIETTQLLLPVLDRACESRDVVDNLTGLVLGLAFGAGAGWLSRARARGDRPGS